MNAPDASLIQWAEARLWLAKAFDDLRVADLSLKANPPLLDPAAFHCQQAIEKMIKGLLVASAVTPPKSHNIEILTNAACPHFPALEQSMRSFIRLTDWLTATRYPDIGGGLGELPSDIEAVLSAAFQFHRDILALAPTA